MKLLFVIVYILWIVCGAVATISGFLGIALMIGANDQPLTMGSDSFVILIFLGLVFGVAFIVLASGIERLGREISSGYRNVGRLLAIMVLSLVFAAATGSRREEKKCYFSVVAKICYKLGQLRRFGDTIGCCVYSAWASRPIYYEFCHFDTKTRRWIYTR